MKKAFRVVFLQFSWEGTAKRLKWEFFGWRGLQDFAEGRRSKLVKFQCFVELSCSVVNGKIFAVISKFCEISSPPKVCVES